MRLALSLVLAMVLTPIVSLKTAQAQDAAVFAVSYIDVAPASRDAAVGLLRKLATASRKDEGNTRFEILQRTTPSNQFAIVATWKDQKAYDAHVAAAHTKEFREKIKPLLISAIDDRAHAGMEIAGDGAKTAARRDLCSDACRRPAAEEGRLHCCPQDAGRGQPQGRQFGALRGVPAGRTGPTTSRWSKSGKTRAAYDAHITAAHTKKFRDQLTPMSGALYDERLYKAI